MKKRILSVLMLLTALVALVGCTPSISAYLEKTNEVAAWKGSDVNGTIEMKLSAKDAEGKAQEVEVTGKMTGTSEGTEKAHVNVDMDLTKLKAIMAEDAEQMPADLNTIPDSLKMDMYVIGEKLYINKGYFELIGGKDSLKDIKEDYIAIDANEEQGALTKTPNAVMNYIKSAEFESDLLAILDKAVKGYESGIELKVEGNKFSYEVTSDELVDEAAKVAETVVANWDNVSDDVQKLLNKMEAGVSVKDIDKAALVEGKDEFVKATADIKNAIKGSSIKGTEEFGEDKYTQTLALNLKIEDFVAVEMKVNSESVKNENAKVTAPTSVKTLTSEELMSLLMPEVDFNTPFIAVMVDGEPLVFEDQEPTIVEGRTLVPFRTLLEKLGAEVEWNEEAKTVTATKDAKTIVLTIGSDKAVVDGKEVSLDVAPAIENGRTMVPLRFLSENLGYEVKFDAENAPIYLIEVNTQKKEVTTEEKVEAEKVEETAETAKTPEVETEVKEEVKEETKVEEKAEAKSESGYVYSSNPIIKNAKAPAAK